MATTRCRTCGSDMQVPLKYVHSEPQCLGCAQDAHDNEAEHLATAERAVLDAAVEWLPVRRCDPGCQCAECVLIAAVDALILARGKPS